MFTFLLGLLSLMPTVTAYAIDLVQDPSSAIIGTGEFDGPVKIGSALYCIGVWGSTGQVQVYKSTDSGHTWVAQDSATPAHSFSYGPFLVDLVGSRWITGNLQSGFFVFQDFSFTTNTWGLSYGSGGLTNNASGFTMHLLPSGNIRLIHRFNSGSPSFLNRLYWSEYSPGSSSWLSINNLISSENTSQSNWISSVMNPTTGDIGVFHINQGNGNMYYNSISAAGSTSSPFNLSALTSFGIGSITSIVMDGSALKAFIGVYPSSTSSNVVPTVFRGSSIISPTWTSYLIDTNVNDSVKTGTIWKTASGTIMESWSDDGASSSPTSTHHWAEYTDGNTTPTYYDISGFFTTQRIESFSASKDGYIIQTRDSSGNEHMYFIPPNVVSAPSKFYGYIGLLGKNF